MQSNPSARHAYAQDICIVYTSGLFDKHAIALLIRASTTLCGDLFQSHKN